MTWEKPEILEIKMDAEIGSYQMDEEGPQFVSTDRDEAPLGTPPSHA